MHIVVEATVLTKKASILDLAIEKRFKNDQPIDCS